MDLVGLGTKNHCTGEGQQLGSHELRGSNQQATKALHSPDCVCTYMKSTIYVTKKEVCLQSCVNNNNRTRSEVRCPLDVAVL
jgi:hypothetical protein